jgi:hypothetical protein
VHLGNLEGVEKDILKERLRVRSPRGYDFVKELPCWVGQVDKGQLSLQLQRVFGEDLRIHLVFLCLCSYFL